MQTPVNLLRGVTRAEVTTPYPERFVNLCAANRIDFWDTERDGVTLRLTMNSRGFFRLRSISAQHGFEIKRLAKRGVPVLLKNIKRRVALIAGIIAVIAALRISALYVWQIDVYGNETVSSAAILSALRDSGFDIGSFAPSVDSAYLSELMLLRIPELSWLAINVHGSRAEVLVREKTPKPEIIDRNTPTEIRASKDGIITKLTVLDGAPAVTIGSEVKKGDIIVSSTMPSRAGARSVHALADVEAQTFYELKAVTPIETEYKRYTGEEKSTRRLLIGEDSFKLYKSKSSPEAGCDEIVSIRTLTLPGGSILPVRLVTTRYVYYDTVKTSMNLTDAEEMLMDSLKVRLEAEIAGGEIVSMRWDTAVEDGIMIVTLSAECIENIGLEVTSLPPESNPSA